MSPTGYTGEQTVWLQSGLEDFKAAKFANRAMPWSRVRFEAFKLSWPLADVAPPKYIEKAVQNNKPDAAYALYEQAAFKVRGRATLSLHLLTIFRRCIGGTPTRLGRSTPERLGRPSNPCNSQRRSLGCQHTAFLRASTARSSTCPQPQRRSQLLPVSTPRATTAQLQCNTGTRRVSTRSSLLRPTNCAQSRKLPTKTTTRMTKRARHFKLTERIGSGACVPLYL
jgi:hypothetical protein